MTGRLADEADVIATLQGGGLACFPTETVWSLSCLAADRAAVAGLRRAKRRPAAVPLALGLARPEDARDAVRWTPGAEALARRFWPGPLSIVLERLATGEAFGHLAPSTNTLSLRVPDHDAAGRILRACGPLVMTSANRHGEPDPLTSEQVMAAMRGAGAAVLADSQVPGIASTVVDATGSAPRVLREGVIPTAGVAAAWP